MSIKFFSQDEEQKVREQNFLAQRSKVKFIKDERSVPSCDKIKVRLRDSAPLSLKECSVISEEVDNFEAEDLENLRKSFEFTGRFKE